MIQLKTNKVGIVKIVASNVVQYSVSFTVGSIVHATCPTATSAQKAKMVVGSYALGAVAAEKSGQYVNRQIDSIVNVFKTAKSAENIVITQ